MTGVKQGALVKINESSSCPMPALAACVRGDRLLEIFSLQVGNRQEEKMAGSHCSVPARLVWLVQPQCEFVLCSLQARTIIELSAEA